MHTRPVKSGTSSTLNVGRGGYSCVKTERVACMNSAKRMVTGVAERVQLERHLRLDFIQGVMQSLTDTHATRVDYYSPAFHQLCTLTGGYREPDLTHPRTSYQIAYSAGMSADGKTVLKMISCRLRRDDQEMACQEALFQNARPRTVSLRLTFAIRFSGRNQRLAWISPIRLTSLSLRTRASHIP